MLHALLTNQLFLNLEKPLGGGRKKNGGEGGCCVVVNRIEPLQIHYYSLSGFRFSNIKKQFNTADD